MNARKSTDLCRHTSNIYTFPGRNECRHKRKTSRETTTDKLGRHSRRLINVTGHRRTNANEDANQPTLIEQIA